MSTRRNRIPPSLLASLLPLVGGVHAAAAGPAVPAPPQSWPLRTDPVQVDARLLHEEPVGTPGTHQFVFAITVHGAPHDQVLTTSLMSPALADALRTLRTQTLWRSPFLLIHLDLGVGSRLDGNREAVYEVQGGTLRPLGQLLDPGGAAGGYSGRRFIDYWTPGPPATWGLCQTCLPTLTVKLIERDGKFEVRRAATWSANQALWQANMQILAQPPALSEPEASSATGFAARLSYYQALVGNAVLAKYCMKGAELTQLLGGATAHLNIQQRQNLQDGLEQVPALIPPSESRPALYALNIDLRTTQP